MREAERCLQQWAREHNRRALLLGVGNLLLVGVHFVTLSGLLALLVLGITRRLHTLDLLPWCPLVAATLIVCSTLVCLMSGDRPSGHLREGAFHNAQDPWAEQFASPNSGRGDDFVWSMLTCCTLGSGRRLLRACGLFFNLHRPGNQRLQALLGLLRDCRERSQAGGWLPVADYPELLPHLEWLFHKEVLRQTTANDGTLHVSPVPSLLRTLNLPPNQ